MNAKDDSSDLQPKKDNVDAQDESGRDSMAWNNEWDDNDSTLGDRELESQHILGYPNGSGGVIDEDEEAIEDEIRANLSSKVSSSLHAYKIAGVALIITLISFTINTVLSRGQCRLLIRARNLHNTYRNDYYGRSHTACSTYTTHRGP